MYGVVNLENYIDVWCCKPRKPDTSHLLIPDNNSNIDIRD